MHNVNLCNVIAKKKPEGYNDKNGENEDYEILTEEGQEGWMEKLLKKVPNTKISNTNVPNSLITIFIIWQAFVLENGGI